MTRAFLCDVAPLDANAIVEALANLIAPRVAALVSAKSATSDLVDVSRYLAGIVSPRAANRAARDAKIDGVRKVGRRWVAPRASVDQWLSQGDRPRAIKSEEDDDDEFAELRRALAPKASKPVRGKKKAA